jgi:hypothetical protein
MNDLLASEGPSEALACAVGLQVRTQYIEQKTARMGRKFHPNPKWDTPVFWTEVGLLCIKIDARPDLFVTAQFEFTQQPDGPFFNALRGKGAVSRYSAWVRTHRPREYRPSTVDMDVDLDEITATMQAAVADSRSVFPDRNMLEAMRSSMIMTPAWLRILLYPGDEEIRRTFGERGALELLQNPVLQRQCRAVGLPVGPTLQTLLDVYPGLKSINGQLR